MAERDWQTSTIKNGQKWCRYVEICFIQAPFFTKIYSDFSLYEYLIRTQSIVFHKRIKKSTELPVDFVDLANMVHESQRFIRDP